MRSHRPKCRAGTLTGLVVGAAAAVSLLNGGPSAIAAFDVKQICHEAIHADLRTSYGHRSSGAYSITHETVANRHGNLKEVHGDGRYQSSGGTRTLKFDCVVNLSNGRVERLDVHD